MKQDPDPQNINTSLGTPGMSRRKVLSLLGATTAASVVGIDSLSALEKTEGMSIPISTQKVTPPSCVVRPQQMEGPYFVDEKLKRSDIRSDPSDSSVKEGVELLLAFHVSRVNGGACTPLPDAIVDIWHCDAFGVYSDVQDRSFDTRGKKFLRGYQMTDENGTAQFTTIYPGWYRGRTPHIHFKIRTASDAQEPYEFTSQLYFADSLTDHIYTLVPYANKGPNTLKNNQDGIFRDGGEQLMLQLTQNEKGYEGAFEIGLQMD